MKLQDQVITLEQAKRLKELGVETSILHHFNGEVRNEAWGDDYYPAFTLAEVFTMLPSCISYLSAEYILHMGKSRDGLFECGYISNYNSLNGTFLIIKNGDAPTQAPCSLLIHLLENRFITPEQCNASLAL